MYNPQTANELIAGLGSELPPAPVFNPTLRRAPDRGFKLTPAQTKVALRNALRYVPESLHETLAPEFLQELKTRGRIYAYRYSVLKQLIQLEISTLEKIEKLEQLRWLENNFSIYVSVTHHESVAIDTPEDLHKIENINFYLICI